MPCDESDTGVGYELEDWTETAGADRSTSWIRQPAAAAYDAEWLASHGSGDAGPEIAALADILASTTAARHHRLQRSQMALDRIERKLAAALS